MNTRPSFSRKRLALVVLLGGLFVLLSLGGTVWATPLQDPDRQTVYFDDPKLPGWPAFARLADGCTFAFGRDWVYVPEQGARGQVALVPL